MVFDADELGLDPEDDYELAYCQRCGLLEEDCECEEEEECRNSFSQQQ